MFQVLRSEFMKRVGYKTHYRSSQSAAINNLNGKLATWIFLYALGKDLE